MNKIILSTLACASIVLATNTSKYELSPMFGQADTHHQLNDALKHEKSIGLTLGIKNDDDCSFDQLELALFRSNDVDYKGSTQDTDITRFLVSGVKNYPIGDQFSLYALIGLGYEKISDKLYDIDSEFVGNAALGAKYSFSDSFALKAEARTVVRAKKENSSLYHLGLVFPFGDEAKKVEEPKVEEPKVVPAKVEKEKINMETKMVAHFDSDKAIIKANDAKIITEYVNYLKKFPNAKIVVEGHTDSTASEKYNESLAARRAMAVKASIVDQGIDASRIRIESYGETMPVIDNKTKEHRAMNRRVESKIIR